MVKQEIAEHLTGEWQVPLMETCVERPGTWCFSLWCPCVVAYQQREELLELTNEPYVCCGGVVGSGPCSSPRDKSPWLCLEVFCCLIPAIVGNRFLMQTRLDKKNTDCDNCITGMAAGAAVVGACTGNADTKNAADTIVGCVAACMLTQQQIELDHLKQHGGQFVYTGVPEKLKQFVVVPVQESMAKPASPAETQELQLP